MHAFIDYVRSKLSMEQFNILFRSIVLIGAVLSLSVAAIGTATGSILSASDHFSTDKLGSL